jgi:cell division septum initiation protein DivIVA
MEVTMDGSGTIYLKTVNFGGFEKNGVLQYVDELNTKIFSLEAELDEKRTLLASAGDSTAGSEKYEELLKADKAKIAELQTANNSLMIQYQTATDDIKMKDAEIEELRNKTSALEDELADAKRKAAAGTADNSAMDLSTVFIEAQKSASLIVTQAKENARKMDEDAKKLANQVVDDANGKASTIVKKADETASRILTDTENKISEMRSQADRVKNAVERQVNDLDVNVSKLRSVLESFSADSIGRLTETKTIIDRAQNIIHSDSDSGDFVNSSIRRVPPPKFSQNSNTYSEYDEPAQSERKRKPEPEARAESRPEPKPEPKPEPPKQEARPEPRAEARSEARSETRAEARSEARPEPKPEPKQEARPEPKPEARAEAPKKPAPSKPSSKFGFDLSELESLSKLVEGSAGNEDY